jgi:NTE family protein
VILARTRFAAGVAIALAAGGTASAAAAGDGDAAAVIAPHARPRIGLVHGGGGARGAAHVGVLRVLDETIEQLVARSRGTTDFDRLPIPYRAVATDMQKGEMVVLSSGDLARAMRASMSVPGVFAPVSLDGRLLGDGGLTRNLPVDIARQTCADVVTAVAVPNPTPTVEEMQSPLTMAARTLDIPIGANEQQQMRTLRPEDGDVMITVDMGDIGSASFDKVDAAIPLGRAAALEHRAELARYSVPEAEYLAWRESITRPGAGPVRLAGVQLEGLERVNPEYVRATLRLQAGDVVTEKAIANRVNDVFALGDFDTVQYSLTGDPAATSCAPGSTSAAGSCTVPSPSAAWRA